MKHFILFLSSLFFFSFFIVSCDNGDEQLADILYLNPPENSVYKVLDTINIIADISDNNIIESITIDITDLNYNPVLSSFQKSIMLPFYNLNEFYIIDDESLSTGDYYIHISAFDGVQTKHKYRKIRINELPKEYIGISYCLLNNNMLNYGIIDTNDVNTVFYSQNNDHLGMGLLNRKSLFVSSGISINDINTINYKHLSQDWSIPNLSSSSSNLYFTSFGIFDNNVIVGRYNGSFSKYNDEGAILGHGDCLSDYYPIELYKDDKYYIVAEKYLYNTNVKIQSFYEISYMPIDNLTLNMNVVKIMPFGAEKYILLCNDVNDTPEIRIFEINSPNFDEPYDISFVNNKIIDGVQVADGHYILAFEDGLYWYNYSQTSLVNIVNANNITAVDYDDISNVIYYSQANSIFKINFPSLIASNQIALPNYVKDFKLVFNK